VTRLTWITAHSRGHRPVRTHPAVPTRQTEPMSLPSLARRLGHRPWFARLFRRLVPLDVAVGRLTRGRVLSLGLVPSLLLTTTGRRSGRPRTSPLLYVRDGDAFVVIGSNWGQREHPAWSANLLAHPEATVTLDGERIPVRAALVTGEERRRLREILLAEWPAFVTYEQRAAGRQIRIFRLEPPAAGRPEGPDAGRKAD
jgi:deazaflavin-dependent oxidoreductase (nitroreductase family)